MRLIQVGLGPWGRSWANSVLSQASDVETVAWVDPDPGAGAHFATLEQALANVDAEAMLVTSSIGSHAAVATTALRAGKHVLVEKPFTTTVSDAAEAVALAQERSLVLAVAQNYRFFPSMVALAGQVRSGNHGAVERVRVDFRKNHPGRGIDAVGDHVLTQLSIHHFDLMRAVLGREPVRVFCHTWNPLRHSGIAPACADAVIEFEGGLVVNYRASRVSTAAETPWEGEWHVECSAGSIVSEAVAGQSDRAAVLADFVAAVRGGRTTSSPGYDNIRSVALLEAAMRSATTGLPVAL